jgi:asparagine synthase (glutamine-hydrolysing)
MCAIAGVWMPGNTARAATNAEPCAEIVARMLEMQRHRGPEPNSVWTCGGVALGHRRLPILDLSAAGRQPMHSRDGRWTIVFNGEVFNYRELRDEVGGVFRTATDTEVLVEACAAWGVEAALARVHGMFGFALWDGWRGELTLARDRAGEKPLVYFWDGATLAFASELKALEGFHDRRLDPCAVDAYLALGYVPAPLAIMRHCRKLPAGHLIRFQAARGGFGAEPRGANGTVAQAERWWRPVGIELAPRARGIELAPQVRLMELTPQVRLRERAGLMERESLMEEVRWRVGEAVRLRLRSDVPVALSLSGGVDSSVIAAECVRQGARPEAFTVRFDGDETDLPYARTVARRLGLQHTVVDASAADVAEHLDQGSFQQVLFHYDEPFADSSALACFALARALGGRYRVVLDGDGGDEAFGGYRHYEYIGVKQTLKRVAAAAGFCDGAGGGKAAVYVHSKSVFRSAERRRLLAAPGSGHPGRGDTVPAWSSEVPLRESAGGALRQALGTDRELALANALTYKMDIALGAFGMEGRAPLLDHSVLEWGPTLAPRELVRGREKKILLRAAYAGKLPAEVLDRPKHGFGAPVQRWIEGPLRELVRASVPSPWFDRAAQQGAAGQRLWTLFMFSAWAARWGVRW